MHMFLYHFYHLDPFHCNRQLWVLSFSCVRLVHVQTTEDSCAKSMQQSAVFETCLIFADCCLCYCIVPCILWTRQYVFMCLIRPGTSVSMWCHVHCEWSFRQCCGELCVCMCQWVDRDWHTARHAWRLSYSPDVTDCHLCGHRCVFATSSDNHLPYSGGRDGLCGPSWL